MNLKYSIKTVLLLLIIAILSNCASSVQTDSIQSDTAIESHSFGANDIFSETVEPTATVDELSEHLRVSRSNFETMAQENSLREAALRYGSQNGFRRRTWEIRRKLESLSTELSAVYNFNRVASLLPTGAGYLIPPVVVRAQDAFESNPDGNIISVADEYLKITRQARISPTPPNWRDYLLFQPEKPSYEVSLMKAKSEKERQKQEEWIEEGWKAGFQQAEDEFSQRIQRLKQDFEGMLEFKRLQALGVISIPKIHLAEFGITGEPGEVRIGDRTLQIVSFSDFLRETDKWHDSDQ